MNSQRDTNNLPLATQDDEPPPMPVRVTSWRPIGKGTVVGADGRVLRDDNGKIRYKIGLKWSDRVSSDRFNVAVLAAITAQYGSGALNGDAS
jgi:hypothetical protein